MEYDALPAHAVPPRAAVAICAHMMRPTQVHALHNTP